MEGITSSCIMALTQRMCVYFFIFKLETHVHELIRLLEVKCVDLNTFVFCSVVVMNNLRLFFSSLILPSNAIKQNDKRWGKNPLKSIVTDVSRRSSIIIIFRWTDNLTKTFALQHRLTEGNYLLQCLFPYYMLQTKPLERNLF